MAHLVIDATGRAFDRDAATRRLAAHPAIHWAAGTTRPVARRPLHRYQPSRRPAQIRRRDHRLAARVPAPFMAPGHHGQAHRRGRSAH